jgi:hypothetical protein
MSVNWRWDDRVSLGYCMGTNWGSLGSKMESGDVPQSEIVEKL